MKGDILVVCHDAGGAEVVSAYVKKHLQDDCFICCVAGPAEKIFKRKKIKIEVIQSSVDPEVIFRRHPDVKFLLTGTSWESGMELRFINIANKLGVRSATYLDHWDNLRERFGYPRLGWKQNLSDEIWVGDKYAQKMAKNFFSKVKLRHVTNLYWQEIKGEYKKIINKKKSNAILCVVEPISAPNNSFGDVEKRQLNELQILDLCLSSFAYLGLKQKIIVRLHPSEKKDKYDKVLRKYFKKLKIVKSGGGNLLSDIGESTLVVGMDSMALVVALLCGKKVVSFLPDKTKKSSLPFKEIIKYNSVNDFIHFLSKYVV